MDVNGSLQIVNELSVGGNGFTAGTASLVLISNGSGNSSSLSTHLAGSNIYKANGILTENRVVTQGAYTMSFVGTSTNGFSINGILFL